MKIIANSAWLESAKAEKSLEIANDADVAELVASGALQGIEQVVLHFPKFTDGRAYTQAVLLRVEVDERLIVVFGGPDDLRVLAQPGLLFRAQRQPRRQQRGCRQ